MGTLMRKLAKTTSVLGFYDKSICSDVPWNPHRDHASSKKSMHLVVHLSDIKSRKLLLILNIVDVALRIRWPGHMFRL